MPIYVVGASNQRVHIPADALAVSITGAVSSAELDVRAGAEQPVVRSSAHHAVLPRLTGPVHIAVRPVGGERFAAGSVIHLAIAHENSGDVDPVQVLFDPVDVSGDSGVVFAVLTPSGTTIEVGVSAVADTPLSPLGAAARSSARKVIGRSPADQNDALIVALDTSASMCSWFADGSVAAATDVIVGVAAAVGCNDVSVVLAGSQITAVSAAAEDAAGLANTVAALAPRWTAGVRWSQLSPDGRTVVCTDDASLAVQKQFPIFLLSDDPRLDGTTARLSSPPKGEGPAAALLAHPHTLDQITTQLVRALT
ncbi:hypothetical protein ACTJJE_14770 [Mycolicibacterium sp. 22603]|uniref:hypothetical protein n=1 Tax=Mycolicibacterium sp. 22603 TaxID=3453950 RepID=UPI003F8416DC